LVLGASGGLGVMAVQIAKAVGARVIAVVGGEEKSRIVERLGADVVVDYRHDGWEERVRQATPGALGVDVVYDAIGAVESGIKCLKYRGRLVIVGFAAREGKMEKVRANRILLKSAMVHGYVSVCIDLLAYGTDHKDRDSARMGDMILRRRKMYGMDSCSWLSKERSSP
jgi:NADPH:quinone reductase-like Zn-dependent oxidoreductase